MTSPVPPKHEAWCPSLRLRVHHNLQVAIATPDFDIRDFLFAIDAGNIDIDIDDTWWNALQLETALFVGKAGTGITSAGVSRWGIVRGENRYTRYGIPGSIHNPSAHALVCPDELGVVHLMGLPGYRYETRCAAGGMIALSHELETRLDACHQVHGELSIGIGRNRARF